MTLLTVRGLAAGYGPVKVLDGIDLEVGAGEFVVMLGAGTVEFDGRDIHRETPDAIVRAGVAQVPQGRGTFPELSVTDNMMAGAYVRHGATADVRSDMEKWFDVFPRLRERRDQRAGSLSGGEQQMLAIARALMSRPRLLLCDEPSLGLAPLITQELFAVLGRLNREDGLSVLLVEQNANLAMHLASRVYLLETGRIVASGSAAEIGADDSIRKAYLGF